MTYHTRVSILFFLVGTLLISNVLFAQEKSSVHVASKLIVLEKSIEEAAQNQDQILKNQDTIKKELDNLRVWINKRR